MALVIASDPRNNRSENPFSCISCFRGSSEFRAHHFPLIANCQHTKLCRTYVHPNTHLLCYAVPNQTNHHRRGRGDPLGISHSNPFTGFQTYVSMGFEPHVTYAGAANETFRRTKHPFCSRSRGRPPRFPRQRFVLFCGYLRPAANFRVLSRIFAPFSATICTGCLEVYETMMSCKNAMLSGRWSR